MSKNELAVMNAPPSAELVVKAVTALAGDVELTERQIMIAEERAKDINSGDDILPFIKGPASNAPFFQMDGETFDSLEVVILAAQKQMSFWPSPEPKAGQLPFCQSNDGSYGIARVDDEAAAAEADLLDVKHPALEDGSSGPHLCASCLMNKFGAGKNGSKLCNESRFLLVLPIGKQTPYLLRAPKMSVKNFDEFKGIARRRVDVGDYYMARCKLTGKPSQSSTGTEYYQIAFELSEPLSDDDFLAVSTIRSAMMSHLQRDDVINAEVQVVEA